LGLLDVPRRFPLTSFFVIAYAWTWLCWWSIAVDAAGRLSLPIPRDKLATLGQFGPFVAALGVAWATGGGQGLRELLGRLVRWRARPVWLPVSLLLLPATMFGAILLYARFRGTAGPLVFRDTWSTLPVHFVYSLLLCGPLGEEPGWRGFALPRLQAKHGPVAASIWLGLLWAGWHWPLWFLYPAPCPFALYVTGAILMTILFTWLYNHTRESVFYSLLFHASLSTASARLPEVPAYHYWVLILLIVVLGILVCDRRLGLPRSGIPAARMNSLPPNSSIHDVNIDA
jgi:membrane protease YdiL (CAAX protease family)